MYVDPQIGDQKRDANHSFEASNPNWLKIMFGFHNLITVWESKKCGAHGAHKVRTDGNSPIFMFPSLGIFIPTLKILTNLYYLVGIFVLHPIKTLAAMAQATKRWSKLTIGFG